MYNLELEKAIDQIKEMDAKKVVIQLPDGLKPRAKEIVDTLEKKTDAKVMIWLSSCYGACDLPWGLKGLHIDLLIQWGHNPFHRTLDGW